MRLRQTLGLSLVLLVMSSGAMAKSTSPASNEQTRGEKKPVAEAKAKAVKATAHRNRAPVSAAARAAARLQAQRHLHAARRAAERRYAGPVRAIGAREVGTAAWYGGRHLGRRTASGDRLDAIRATAAHRSLPLNSLARVTNLDNGRSVIVIVTDRGPASHSLLIDLSPSAADKLDMKRAGIVPVSVEPVAMVATAAND